MPVPDELNRYMLTVKNLPQGRYEMRAEDRRSASSPTTSSPEGVNLASATADGWEPGGPWDAQAWVLTHLTEARNQISLGHRFLDHYLPAHPDRAAIHAQDAEINRNLETLQRTLLKPRPFHFVLRPVPAK